MNLVERGIILRKIDKRRNNLRVVADRSSVEVIEAIKSKDIGRRSGCFLFEDRLNFLGVFLKSISAYD